MLRTPNKAKTELNSEKHHFELKIDKNNNKMCTYVRYYVYKKYFVANFLTLRTYINSVHLCWFAFMDSCANFSCIYLPKGNHFKWIIQYVSYLHAILSKKNIYLSFYQ